LNALSRMSPRASIPEHRLCSVCMLLSKICIIAEPSSAEQSSNNKASPSMHIAQFFYVETPCKKLHDYIMLQAVIFIH
jgi:hypothetical protein